MLTESSTAITKDREHHALRILFLAPFPPRFDATHGGGRAMAQVISGVAATHNVAVLHLRGDDESGIDPQVAANCEAVWAIERPRHDYSGMRHWAYRLRVLWGRMRGHPEWVTGWSVPAAHDQLDAAFQEWRPDVVQVEYSVMGQYLRSHGDKHIPSIITIHEPTVQALREGLIHARSGLSLRYLDYLAWRRYEPKIIAAASAVVVFTERDEKAIRQLSPEAPTVQIPLGADLPKSPLDPLGSEPPSVVFVGNFSHPPNVDAGRRLLHSIFPQVLIRVPNARLIIVGDHVPDEFRLMATDSIVVTGRVPSVVPFLDQAAVVATPLRLGGGMRVKVLEALASGKAVVTSPRAVEGLDVRHGEQVMLADNDSEFADAIVTLLECRELRLQLAKRARSWTEANLGWDRSISTYDELYRLLVQKSSHELSGGCRATLPLTTSALPATPVETSRERGPDGKQSFGDAQGS